MDGTISENLHDVSHLISVRSECARLYVGYLFSITLALCPIHTSHKCGPWNHQNCTKSQQVKWLSTFAKLVKRLNPAKFTSTIPPLLPVETSTLRGSISDITTSQVLSPQLKLPSYIISDRSTPTSGLKHVGKPGVDKNGRVSLNPSPFTAAAGCHVMFNHLGRLEPQIGD